jgi:predicted transposase/invertase (TIGR01784 family)
MDKAILMVQTKLEVIARNPEMLRAYEQYEKAESDWTSSINGAWRQGEQQKAVEIARNLKATGDPVEKIARATGLTPKQVEEL